MANLYLNLPMPVGNGPGAAVDTSQMGRTKTITVTGAFAGSTITIEISTDAGATWAQLFSFQNDDLGRKTFLVSANRMRVNVSGRNAAVPFSANADVGAWNNPPAFVNLPMPALNGPGAAVDVSAMGRYMTFIVAGEFPGASVTIEVSEDGTDYVPLKTFNLAGLFIEEVVTQFMRVNVSGRNALRPFTATLDVGLNDIDGGGGGGSGPVSAAGREILPEFWAQNDVPAAQAATAMEAGLSQLFPDYQAIRDGSIIGINLRASAVLTAGSMTAEVTVNGVGTGFVVALAAPASSARATQAQGIDSYVAGDLIGVTLLTAGGLLPTGSLDVEVSVEVDTEI